MTGDGTMWKTLAYVFIGIILIAVALRILGWVVNITLHLAGILFSIIFVIGLIYVIYIIARGALTGK